jgi:uncharacterized protein YndB with AHSA1/START domain
MSTQTGQAMVRTQIVVEAPIEHAFAVFTERFGDFKPPEHNILGVELAETVFEPRVGGHIYDRAVDGSECRWARVLAYEPPHRVMFSWDLDPRWQVEVQSRQDQRGRGAFHCRNSAAHPGGAGASPHRPARRRLAGRQRRCRWPARLAAVPTTLRWPVRPGGLMAPITTTTEVKRAPAEVFDYVTDPTRFIEWQRNVVGGHMETNGPTTVGTKCLTTRRIGFATRAITAEVTHIDPPRAWGVHGIDGPIRAIVNVTVDPLDDGRRSRLTIEIDLAGHGIGKLLVPLGVRRQVRNEMSINLCTLKQRLEDRARPTSAPQ